MKKSGIYSAIRWQKGGGIKWQNGIKKKIGIQKKGALRW